MIQKTIQVFTEKEEEFVSLLTKIGTQKNVAKMLVYLARMKKATSRDLERGADLRQPEVSIAMRYMAGRGWVECQEIPPETTGRPVKLWTLALPVGKILDIIGNEKQDELRARLDMIQKIRAFA